MDKPSWQRDSDEREAETWEMLHRHGERESARQSLNFLEGDDLGLEDGRPGIDPGTGVMTMSLEWRIILWFAGLAATALLAFGTRACIGEERAQEILNGEPERQTEQVR